MALERGAPQRPTDGWVQALKCCLQDREELKRCNFGEKCVMRTRVGVANGCFNDATQHAKVCQQGLTDAVDLHNSVLFKLCHFIRRAGGRAYPEPVRGITGYAKRGQRVDIVAIMPDGQKFMIEVSGTISDAPSNMRTGGKWRQFPQSSCAANQRESAKRSKYSGVRFKSFGKQRRYKFVFAFEDGGAYGDDAIMFLNHLSKVQKQHNEDLLERGEPVESPQDFQRELWTGLSRLIQSGVARRIRGVNLDVEFASLVEMHKRGVHFDDDSDLHSVDLSELSHPLPRSPSSRVAHSCGSA